MGGSQKKSDFHNPPSVKHTGSCEEVKDIITHVFAQLAGTKPQEQADIYREVERIFSSQEKRHLRISGLKNQTLFFSVDSSAWLYQFNLKKQRILGEIQKSFPDIHKVYFKIGKVT